MKGLKAFDESEILNNIDSALAVEEAVKALAELSNNCESSEEKEKQLTGTCTSKEITLDSNVSIASEHFEDVSLRDPVIHNSGLSSNSNTLDIKNENKEQSDDSASQESPLSIKVEKKRKHSQEADEPGQENECKRRVVQEIQDNTTKTVDADSCVTGVENTGCNPKIVFLGTGAAIPSKYRNVSSILVYLR